MGANNSSLSAENAARVEFQDIRGLRLPQKNSGGYNVALAVFACDARTAVGINGVKPKPLYTTSAHAVDRSW